jgi:hypothetical protein
VISAFYAEFQYAVFSVLCEGGSQVFTCQVTPSARFQQFVPAVTLGETVNPADDMPYLDNFLFDAAFWQRQSVGMLALGPWKPSHWTCRGNGCCR